MPQTNWNLGQFPIEIHIINPIGFFVRDQKFRINSMMNSIEILFDHWQEFG
jgi:tRNA(Leu) C34 or U34 (ribose-2'-O)-methylase TrmL